MEIEQATKILKEEISGLPKDNPFYEAFAQIARNFGSDYHKAYYLNASCCRIK